MLGTITEPQRLLALMVRLNGGGYQKLHVGPDGLRLRGPGDFNAEFPVSSLLDGENKVEFLATDHKGRSTSTTVRVNFAAHTVWPLPYHIRWQNAALISDAVQVVDGKWSLSGMGIRPVHPAYDRLIVLGDHNWTDVRVRIALTLHGFVPGDQGHLQGGFGILTRWTGHYADAYKPSREWRPSGAIGWYRARWEDSPALTRNFNISDAVIEDRAKVETTAQHLDMDHPAVFEMSVRSQPGSTSHYHFRTWYQDAPHRLLCDLETEGTPGESAVGSILLIALYTDVTIGDIDCEPL